MSLDLERDSRKGIQLHLDKQEPWKDNMKGKVRER